MNGEESTCGVDAVEAPSEDREAKLVCYEAYAALGTILMDLAERGHPQAEKLMDNLSEARLVHKDVLPFADVDGVKVPAPAGFILSPPPVYDEHYAATQADDDGVAIPQAPADDRHEDDTDNWW